MIPVVVLLMTLVVVLLMTLVVALLIDLLVQLVHALIEHLAIVAAQVPVSFTPFFGSFDLIGAMLELCGFMVRQ